MSRRPRASLTTSDLAAFTASVQALAPLSTAAVAQALPQLTIRELARGEAFLRAGARAGEVAVVAQGWLREFYLLADGSERTKAFVFEGQSTGSLADLMRDDVSTAFILAETEVRLLCWPYAAYRALCERSAEWARFHVALIERLFMRKARREYELLSLDAAARYRALLEQSPGIEQRVPAKHLASYLGITPVHLSRLRRRRARSARSGS